MKFGEKLLQSRFEPWSEHYLNYGELKRLLDEDGDFCDANASGIRVANRRIASNASLSGLLTHAETSQGLAQFIARLNEQVERILMFFLKEQAAIASELQDCRREQAMLQQQQQQQQQQRTSEETYWDVALAQDSEQQEERQQQLTPEELALFHKFYRVAVHLLRLIQFVDLNMTGLRKILKKHDKCFTARLSQIYLGRRSVVLQPLVSNDSIDALTKILESALKEWTEHVRERHNFNHLLWSTRSLDDKDAPSPASNLKKTWSFVTLANQTHNDLEGVFGEFAKQDNDANVKSSRAILLQIKLARSRLQETSDLQKMLAAPVLLLNNEGQHSQGSQEDDVLQDEQDAAEDGMAPDRTVSNFLNYFSTFLYMANYYIVAPASNTYAEKLGGNAAQAGIIIGMTSVAALVSTILYSWWTSYTYKSALLFASVCSCIGNLCYGLGLPFDSLTLVLVGRLWNGFGSARSINRRYIADSYSRGDRTAASATFVTAGALGCSMGPAIAALLGFLIPDDSDAPNQYWQAENAPGWIMFVVWSIFLITLALFFKDPPRRKPKLTQPKQHIESVTRESQPLILTSNNAPPEITVMKRGICGTLNEYVSVIVPFTIYFILKLILESTLSSIPMLTHHYFKWTGQSSGTYLAILGLLLLPASSAVGYLSTFYDDRVLVVAIQLCMTVGCFTMLNYGEIHEYPLMQYLIASILCYVSTSALEGPNMSLLSKTIPSKWSEGFFNIGLLATEAGTLGRAVADVLLTACGADGLDYVLNRLFGICAGLSLGLLALSLQFYGHLVPRVEHDDF